MTNLFTPRRVATKCCNGLLICVQCQADYANASAHCGENIGGKVRTHVYKGHELADRQCDWCGLPLK